jgi:hypothetical protein
MNQRLLHDCAWRMTQGLLGMTDPNVHTAEGRALFTKLYEACKAGLEWYDIQARRLEKRLYPRDES